jgi:hypothetical protein
MASMLDHLVFATRDLAAAVERFAAATGVQPVEGGRHEGRGTRNYLLGLGPTSYLEIIGPDLERPGSQSAPFGIDELTADRLVTWAVRPDDIESAVIAAKEAGADLGPILPMSRSTPTGEVLTWRLALAHPAPYDGIVPFLIDWGSSRHPAGSGLPSVELVEFGATYPRPDDVNAVLDALEIALPVGVGEAALRAVVAGPGGSYSLR